MENAAMPPLEKSKEAFSRIHMLPFFVHIFLSAMIDYAVTAQEFLVNALVKASHYQYSHESRIDCVGILGNFVFR